MRPLINLPILVLGLRCRYFVGKQVIRWKLNEVMAVKRVRNKELAEGVGVTETTVYRLRKVDEMPRLTPERLNSICQFLKCQPGDLLVYEPDLPEGTAPTEEYASSH